MGNAANRENPVWLRRGFYSSFQPLAGRYLGLYGPHGFELIELTLTHEKLVATKLTGDPNVPAGQVTFEIESDGTARGRVAETGFKNPLWIPGWIDWDGEDPDEFAFHFEGCGNIQFLRVSPNFELSEQSLRLFVAHNYTRVAFAHGMWWILPKQQRPASDAALDALTQVLIDTNAKAQAQRCTICLLDFEEGDMVSQLPCRHVYHPDCAKKWLSKQNCCPLCKKSLPEKSAAASQEQQHHHNDQLLLVHSPTTSTVAPQVTSS